MGVRPMTDTCVVKSIADELIYPVLCLSKRAGISVVRSPEAFGRGSAALFGAGFYTGLRVVDASGAVYEVVSAEMCPLGRHSGGRSLDFST